MPVEIARGDTEIEVDVSISYLDQIAVVSDDGSLMVDVGYIASGGIEVTEGEVLDGILYIDGSAPYEPYEGAYEVTPTSESLVLPTSAKIMTQDLVIDPIPSNYGLITWNGSVLTVS